MYCIQCKSVDANAKMGTTMFFKVLQFINVLSADGLARLQGFNLPTSFSATFQERVDLFLVSTLHSSDLFKPLAIY